MTVLVGGAPCSGKSTWIQGQGSASVLDFDAIVEEITGERYTQDTHVLAHAQALWWARVEEGPGYVALAWPQAWRRKQLAHQIGARLVLIDTPLDVCLERARAERPTWWVRYVVDWFAAFTSTRDETVVRSDFSLEKSRTPLSGSREKSRG